MIKIGEFIRYRDWGLQWGLVLGIGIGDWDWGLGLRLGIGIEDRD